MTASLVLLFAVAWVSPGHVEDIPTPMDPNALYSALNTIAQCAAALAALIGFLGMWRLDRLRDEVHQCVQMLFVLNQRISQAEASANFLPDEVVIQAANNHIKFWESLSPTQQTANRFQGEWMRQLQRELARQKDLSHEQRWLIHILSAFLAVTLICIFVPAILGIVHADRLKMWVWTPWLLYVASAWLGLSSAYVVWQAARSIRTLAILTLLAMASPALAGPVGRCTTHYEPTLNRLMTL